jgi:kanamycin kinase
LAAPTVAVRTIGAGLRMLHDRLLPVRLVGGQPPEHADAGAPGPRGRAAAGRSAGGLSGDACSPNTLIDDDGTCVGRVDFGSLGVADRWADLAVPTLSLGWNYPGRVWDAEFFAAYGVEPDSARIDYYRRLWQTEDGTSDDEASR